MYLNCHTYYSLRYGVMAPETLVMQARQSGIGQLAITDINNVTAVPEFVRLCRSAGLSAVAGMEFRKGGRLLYVVLARNPEGFSRINAFMSLHQMSGTELPKRFPVCEHTFAIYPFGENALPTPGEHEYTGVRPWELNRFSASRLPQYREQMVALPPVTFLSEKDYPLHRYLRAIDHNLIVSRLQPNHLAHPDETLCSPGELRKKYGGFPYLLGNAEKLLAQCHMDFDFHTSKNKKTFTGNRADDRALLTKLAMDGLEYRYGTQNKEAIRRVLHELEVIDRMGFSSYFLITWDIIRYSMSRGFYHVGRGSGANSIVAYCLRITNVDPIELDLYFERFINPKRTTPPDFDIDYSWKDRDQVLDYIFKRYGREHTALLGTISTFRDRSMTRELGKTLGLPKAEIDALVSKHRSPGKPDTLELQINDLAAQLADFPNMRSIHAGGILISELPICYYSALDMPPKGFPTVQWDMYTAEELAFEKIDILSQRGIGHINECVGIVQQNHGVRVDIHNTVLLKNDEKVKAQLRSGETTGCFYVESPAMRGLLKKLRCDNYISLVAASSIIRPGVARSGMMREYIYRFHNPGSFQFLHPVMEQQLKETYGVMVYQEDVIKVCHHFAGLDLADADVLRRAMSGKYRSKKEMQRIIDRFFENCSAKGYPESLTREVWRQIESFAGYSFSKAHSASFAVESYQSLYLKAHYPLEFMTAVINNFGGFYQSPVYFNEARRCGANIELPCVNRSSYITCVSGSDIFIGFVHIQNLEYKLAQCIATHRRDGGPYLSLEDFAQRTGAGLEQLLLLIRVNAFRFTGIAKAHLMWKAHLLTGKKTVANPMLFAVHEKPFQFPEPETNLIQNAYDELELLGFTVSISPFDMAKSKFRGEVMGADMLLNTGKKVRMVGWLVTTKYVRTVKNELMAFGCFIDVQGNFFDTLHFPDTVKAWPFRGNGVYLLLGTVSEEFGFPSLTVEKMARMPMKPDPRG
ncbi:MAG TPA: DNA polymerase III subunit alpha [Bacteroidales bacterium]|nr:DNA polymerase III subunit alpha [Bacteroidales bacterium]